MYQPGYTPQKIESKLGYEVIIDQSTIDTRVPSNQFIVLNPRLEADIKNKNLTTQQIESVAEVLKTYYLPYHKKLKRKAIVKGMGWTCGIVGVVIVGILGVSGATIDSNSIEYKVGIGLLVMALISFFYPIRAGLEPNVYANLTVLQSLYKKFHKEYPEVSLLE